MGASINPISGRIAALSVSEHVAFERCPEFNARKCIPVSCAPCALHCIPAIEFLEAPKRQGN